MCEKDKITSEWERQSLRLTTFNKLNWKRKLEDMSVAPDAFPKLRNQPVTPSWCMYANSLQSQRQKSVYRTSHILSLLLEYLLEYFAKLDAEIVIISPRTSSGKERKWKHSPFLALTAKELLRFSKLRHSGQMVKCTDLQSNECTH